MSEFMRLLEEQKQKEMEEGSAKGKQRKEKITEWLNQNVNMPLAERGYPNLGAGLSAAADTAADLILPDNVNDPYEMAPSGLVKPGTKALKGFLIPKITKATNAEDAAKQLAKAKVPMGQVVDKDTAENRAIKLVEDLSALKEKPVQAGSKVEDRMRVSGSGSDKQFLIDRIQKPAPKPTKKEMDEMGVDPALQKLILED